MQRNLIVLFAFLSICAFFQMLIFGSFDGLDFMPEEVLTLALKSSFGNMGFSKSICGKSSVQYDEVTSLMFQCESTTTIHSVLYSGLLLDKNYGGEDNA